MQEEDSQSANEDVVLYEQRHLDKTLSMIRESIGHALGLEAKTEADYQSVKSYMVDYRAEIDPSELYQNELYLKEVDRMSAEAAGGRQRLEKLLDSPYFARIDFVASDGRTIAYIGRFAFTYQNESVISDWRSPVASLFYEFDFGEARYEAPTGWIDGRLEGKRQLEIADGRLVYAVETSSSVRDEILQYELGKVSDQKMKSIVSSIQKEQNAIIRDEREGSLIIQGVAGSGKTSIALHRVAYMLFRQKDSLHADSVAILSPNKVFGDYISKVLPELGEEPLHEIYLRDIVERMLPSTLVVDQPRSFIDDSDEAWKARARYKGSLEFACRVKGYLTQALESIFAGTSLTFGKYTVEAEWLEKRFYGYGGLPISERLNYLVSDILADLGGRITSRVFGSLPTRGEIRSKLVRMLSSKEPLALYRQFFRQTGHADMLLLPRKEKATEGCPNASAKQHIEWEDASPLVFFKAAFDGWDGFSRIRHLVIDEMQDLTPIQHCMVAQAFSCSKTILGDYHQMVDPSNAMTLEKMREVYGASQVFELLRSYRSTLEIMDLAKKVKDVPEIETVARHGDAPRIVACGDTSGVIRQLGAAIEEYPERGYKTLGILHKSDELARRYYELLSCDYNVHLVDQESSCFENGVSVASIKMAKGLEFDEVILLDADAAQYHTGFDRNLLYVAITRAMHRLTILYRQKATPFVKGFSQTPESDR